MAFLRRTFAPTALVFLAVASMSSAQTSFPMLMSTKPAAVQAGQTSEVELASRYSMAGATQVLVAGAGLTGEIAAVEAEPGKESKSSKAERLKVRFTAAKDALPGVRDFRIVTPRGPSTLGQIVVVRDAVVVEQDKNDSPAAAQQIELPCTVCGAIETNEDVDCFKFTIATPTSLAFHVRAARLQDKIHDLQSHVDPILTLKNAAGTVLAQADNYFFADPVLCHRLEAGEYCLEIRDVRYQGNAYWEYAVEINDRPLAVNAFPLAAPPSAETPLELVGLQLPENARSIATLPSDAAEGPTWLSLPLGDSKTNPVPLMLTRLPIVTEASAAANDAPDNGAKPRSQPIDAPCMVNGRIEQEADVDRYRVDAKKGDAWSLEVLARRYQSSLDGVLRIVDAQGKVLAESDDLAAGRRNSADPWIENWTAPADGQYVVELRDLHLRGGPSFIYALRIERAEPEFSLEMDSDKTPLAPGTNNVIFVRATRRNGFDGEIQLEVAGLPAGVSAACGKIPPDGKDGCIVLSAAVDAPQGAANVVVSGRGTYPAGDDRPPLVLSAVALPLQETYFPGGGRGHFPAEMHTVAVGEPLDIRSVKVSPESIVLKPGESQAVEITIERAPGFDKNVTLDCYYRHLNSMYGDCLPKGVTVDDKQSQTLLTGDKSQGKIVFKAAADAPPATGRQIAIMAQVSINFAMKSSYSGPALSIAVTPK